MVRPHRAAGNKLRICSFWLLLSCRGNVTSNLMIILPFCPGCLLIGMPSPLQQPVSQQSLHKGTCWSSSSSKHDLQNWQKVLLARKYCSSKFKW